MDFTTNLLQWAEGLFRFTGRAVCHQRPERTMMVGGRLLPFCARCTGIYTGIVCSLLLIVLLNRSRGNKAFSPGISICLVAGFFPMAWDALSSYIGLRETTNLMRYVSGGWFAFGLPFLYLLLKNYDIDGENDQPILRHWFEPMLVLVCTSLLYLISRLHTLLGWFFFSIVSCLGFYCVLLGVVRLLFGRIKWMQKNKWATFMLALLVLVGMSLANLFLLQKHV